ncbi:gamma-aminobutyric acid receptor subunit alpha-6-like [Tachypleus tridentatus]|uniref:gamma-aminobutyric acid receptor subunit alpha-6-like n=1 Tax=Tachypleus tridentatus TaxID=6853 RepID=UPI003FD20E2F
MKVCAMVVRHFCFVVSVTCFLQLIGCEKETNNRNFPQQQPVDINVAPKRKQRLFYLDNILSTYDKRAWPTYGTDNPTAVKVNIYINSLGSVSAANMDYTLDIYLRQSWLDHRLNLAIFGVNHTVTMSGKDIISRMWKPDLFFRNVKKAALHFVTVPNMLLKISPEGVVLYSMRFFTLRDVRTQYINYL